MRSPDARSDRGSPAIIRHKSLHSVLIGGIAIVVAVIAAVALFVVAAAVAVEREAHRLGAIATASARRVRAR